MTEGSCCADGCDRPVSARDMCSMHYARWRRSGGGGQRCSIDGCDGAATAKGWCDMHYLRWRSTGDVHHQPLDPDASVRFWHYADTSGGSDACWPWTGTITDEGYGVIQIDGRQWKAHRWSYVLAGNELADEETIDHLCHTRSPDCHAASACPHRRCVNPRHLEPVSAEVNVSRGMARRPLATHCLRGHPFDEANTRIAPSGARTCRTCHREAEARRRASKRAA